MRRRNRGAKESARDKSVSPLIIAGAAVLIFAGLVIGVIAGRRIGSEEKNEISTENTKIAYRE